MSATLAVADDLPQLGIPVRIAWGAADQLQKLQYGERFERDLNAPLRRINGGKHFTPDSSPKNPRPIDEIEALPGAGATGGERDLPDHFPTLRSLRR